MLVAFRADASLEIGIGHIMRCLNLADELVARGADCRFICRAHEGNLIDLIRSKGYTTLSIQPAPEGSSLLAIKTADDPAHAAHSHWLGGTQSDDAAVCAPLLAKLRPDWLIVDHYALDTRWERALAPYCHKLMVIDDLADRQHACDLLLDQTFGRDAEDYLPLVPPDCRLLCGSRYALLRPEFAALRPYSLQRRDWPALRELLITMGGVDKNNATGQVLQALRACPLPADCRITVVMGTTAPYLDEVREAAQDLPWPVRVLVGVNDMAQLMADSDLAIGAAGATSWERCCLGLPSVMMVLADNQRYAAGLLEEAKAARILQLDENLPTQLAQLINEVVLSERLLRHLSEVSRVITVGDGVKRIADQLMGEMLNG